MKPLDDIMSLAEANTHEMTVFASGGDGLAMNMRYRLKTHVLQLHVIAAWGYGWDHISVSRNGGLPTWEMMEFVKRHLAKPDETFMQLHVPEDEHINIHPRTLHMWRPHDIEIPKPPRIMV